MGIMDRPVDVSGSEHACKPTLKREKQQSLGVSKGQVLWIQRF